MSFSRRVQDLCGNTVKAFLESEKSSENREIDVLKVEEQQEIEGEERKRIETCYVHAPAPHNEYSQYVLSTCTKRSNF